MTLRTVHPTRYVTPLREGGSLPAIVEADDDGLYVLKFRAAGQGIKALIAELIGAEVARALTLLTPEIVIADLDPALGKNEPDYEIRELLTKSEGQNLALDYLPGSITFDANVHTIDPRIAAQILWLDAFLMNVDRTPRNTNLLLWHKRVWLIDHGAALFFHHGTTDYVARANGAFPQIKDHVFLSKANGLDTANAEAQRLLRRATFEGIMKLVPDEWLQSDNWPSADVHREAYVEFLTQRLAAATVFIDEAKKAYVQSV